MCGLVAEERCSNKSFSLYQSSSVYKADEPYNITVWKHSKISFGISNQKPSDSGLPSLWNLGVPNSNPKHGDNQVLIDDYNSGESFNQDHEPLEHDDKVLAHHDKSVAYEDPLLHDDEHKHIEFESNHQGSSMLDEELSLNNCCLSHDSVGNFFCQVLTTKSSTFWFVIRSSVHSVIIPLQPWTKVNVLDFALLLLLKGYSVAVMEPTGVTHTADSYISIKLISPLVCEIVHILAKLSLRPFVLWDDTTP